MINITRRKCERTRTMATTTPLTCTCLHVAHAPRYPPSNAHAHVYISGVLPSQLYPVPAPRAARAVCELAAHHMFAVKVHKVAHIAVSLENELEVCGLRSCYALSLRTLKTILSLSGLVASLPPLPSGACLALM
jgi:hypothetical protein